MSELQDMLRVQARLHRKQGANALGQLFESAIEEIQLLKKTYNQLFDAFQDCQGELAKANERVKELESDRDELRNSFYARFLDYRGLTLEQACKHCSGSGVKSYGNTSTWRMGTGGQMITSDVCDNCWGSGNTEKPWTNLRQLRKEQDNE